MPFDSHGLIGLTLLVGALLAIVFYAIVRFHSAARVVREPGRSSQPNRVLMSSAVEEAVARLSHRGRELQARAEASERVSDRILGSMTAGLLLIARDGQLVTVNAAGERLLGLGGRTGGHIDLVLAEQPSLRGLLVEAIASGQSVARRTMRCEAPRGATYIGLTISPITAADGDVESVVCLFDDMTAVHALEEQLRLKESLARLGELTAGIAHEFRNGLATIYGYARLMEPRQVPEAYGPYLEAIRHETHALGQVVSNFLSFARPTPLTVTSVDVAGIIGRIVHDVRADVVARGGQLRVEGEFPPVEGDEVLLRQAFSNLCRNAVDACTTTDRAPEIIVRGSLASRDECRIAVLDNGPGIAPEVISRIFLPFFTTRANGTGLGLALVQKILVTHNGRVSASNRAEGGAVFDVVLPFKQSGF